MVSKKQAFVSSKKKLPKTTGHTGLYHWTSPNYITVLQYGTSFLFLQLFFENIKDKQINKYNILDMLKPMLFPT